MQVTKKGFTLIELLIVVAIIAILAAIAIPNFLQAMVRSKVARAQSELQSLATALESYEVDNNTYPLMRGPVSGMINVVNRPEDKDGYTQECLNGFRTAPVELTTPISYLSSLANDPFKNPGTDFSGQSYNDGDSLDLGYIYTNIDEYVAYPGDGFDENDLEAYGDWRLCSIGPIATDSLPAIGYFSYNPTNGTVSAGYILRTQAYADGEKPGYTEP